jgi:hypothetical protein
MVLLSRSTMKPVPSQAGDSLGCGVGVDHSKMAQTHLAQADNADFYCLTRHVCGNLPTLEQKYALIIRWGIGTSGQCYNLVWALCAKLWQA